MHGRARLPQPVQQARCTLPSMPRAAGQGRAVAQHRCCLEQGGGRFRETTLREQREALQCICLSVRGGRATPWGPRGAANDVAGPQLRAALTEQRRRRRPVHGPGHGWRGRVLAYACGSPGTARAQPLHAMNGPMRGARRAGKRQEGSEIAELRATWTHWPRTTSVARPQRPTHTPAAPRAASQRRRPAPSPACTPTTHARRSPRRRGLPPRI